MLCIWLLEKATSFLKT